VKAGRVEEEEDEDGRGETNGKKRERRKDRRATGMTKMKVVGKTMRTRGRRHG
jgi:hypothetical protein